MPAALALRFGYSSLAVRLKPEMLAAGGLLPGSFAWGIGVQFRLPIKVRIGIGSISPFSSAMSCNTNKSCSQEAMLGDRKRGDNRFHRSRTFLSQKSKENL